MEGIFGLSNILTVTCRLLFPSSLYVSAAGRWKTISVSLFLVNGRGLPMPPFKEFSVAAAHTSYYFVNLLSVPAACVLLSCTDEEMEAQRTS